MPHPTTIARRKMKKEDPEKYEELRRKQRERDNKRNAEQKRRWEEEAHTRAQLVKRQEELETKRARDRQRYQAKRLAEKRQTRTSAAGTQLEEAREKKRPRDMNPEEYRAHRAEQKQLQRARMSYKKKLAIKKKRREKHRQERAAKLPPPETSATPDAETPGNRLRQSLYNLNHETMERRAQEGQFRDLYPEIDCYDSGFLKVSDIHSIYYDQSGNKDGNPVLFVHGGPGGGTTSKDRRFFDPKVYRVILFDQRGSGKSTPAAELKENTTWDSVEDMERLRKHLGISKWVVFGGSWGSTLSLTYAEAHPDRVKALVLRGIFTLRRKELEWFYEGKGANYMFPDHFESFRDLIPEVERGSMIDAYYRRLTSDDETVRLKAARTWSTWEMATSHLYVSEDKLKRAEEEAVWALQFARIECHYFVNGGFFKSASHVLDDVDKIRHIPATIVQGRYDMVCPMDTAWELHKRWPEAEFYIAEDSGHNSQEPATRTRLLDATDKYKNL